MIPERPVLTRYYSLGTFWLHNSQWSINFYVCFTNTLFFYHNQNFITSKPLEQIDENFVWGMWHSQKRAPCGCSLFARKVNLLTFVSFMTCFFYNLSNQKFLVTLSDKPKTVVWLDCVYKSLCDLISQLSNLFRFTKWTVSTKTSFRKQSNFFYLRSPKQTERNQIPRLL